MAHQLRVALCYQIPTTMFPRVRKKISAVDILVMPELVDGGYKRLTQGGQPHSHASPLMQFFRSLSRDNNVAVLAGSLFYTEASRRAYNTAFVFSRGRQLLRYDKIHLFRPMNDHRYFTPGKRVPTFRLRSSSGSVKAGVIICYDLRFPELTRVLAAAGTQILFVPARWPSRRNDAWMTLLKARAIENQIFVVGCNARGSEGGYSYVFNPTGKMIFSTKMKSQSSARVDVVTLDLRALKEARTLHNNLEEARVLGGAPGKVLENLT